MPGFQRQMRQMIALRGKVIEVFKSRHRTKAAIEFKAAIVIGTAQKAGFAWLLQKQAATVRTDIGEAVQLLIQATGQEQGFIDAARQKMPGNGLAGGV